MHYFKFMKWIPVLAVVLAPLLWGQQAQAQLFGPPLPTIKGGQFGLGIALADFNRNIRTGAGPAGSSDNSRETVFFDWGVADSAMARFELSTVDLGSIRGEEFAFNYRGSFGDPTELGDGGMKLNKGFMVGVRRADFEDTGIEVEYLQFDVAAGGMIDFNETFSVYFAGIFSKLDGNIKTGGFNADFEADSSAGIYGGGIFNLDESLQFGAELHMIFGTGFGFFGRFAF